MDKMYMLNKTALSAIISLCEWFKDNYIMNDEELKSYEHFLSAVKDSLAISD